MHRRIYTAIAGLLFALVLSGCATKDSLPVLPSRLDANNGLLVARFYVLGMHAMENASISINGRLMSSSMRDGYIAMQLEPGEHKLTQLRAMGKLLSRNVVADDSPYRLVKGYRAPTFIYIPGSSYTVHYTTLSVDRTFRIEPGKITNLGLIIYLPALDESGKPISSSGSRQFSVVNLDNTAEINTFMETNYPDLMRTISSREAKLAPGNYLDPKKLPSLRNMIAYHESRGPNILVSPTKTFVYGRAGTVVALDRNSSGKAGVEVLDTGTLADVVGGASIGDQFNFLTSDAKLLTWDGKKLSSSNLPYRIHPVKLHGLGSNGMIVIDNHMRILTTQSGSDKWTNYEGAMTFTPRSDIDVVSDSEGAYITVGNRGIPDSIYYLKAGTAAPKTLMRFDLKGSLMPGDMHVTVARDIGLFVIFNKPEFFFYSKSKQRWENYSRPKGSCKPMRIDNEGVHLKVECDCVNYESNNSGASWTKQDV